MRTALVVRSCRVLRGRRSPRLLSPDITAAVNLAKESASNPRRRAVRDILLYGACGGLLIVVLKLTEYRFLVVEHSAEIYVGTWEFAYYKLTPGFAEKYAAHMVERGKASGASQQKVDETERQAKEFKQMNDNPAINVALTFMEVSPIGLAVTLLSAGILRKKARA